MRSIFEFHDIQQNIEDEKCVSVFFESVRVIRPEPREECISTLRVPTSSKTFWVFSFPGSDNPQIILKISDNALVFLSP